MYGHNHSDFPAGIVMQEIQLGASSENARKLPVMEHSQSRYLWVYMPDKKNSLCFQGSRWKG